MTRRHAIDLTPLPRRTGGRGRDADDRYLALHPTADPSRFSSPYARLVQRLHAEGLYATPSVARWTALLDVCVAGLGLWLTAYVHPAFGFLAGLGFVRVPWLQHDLLHLQWSGDPLEDEWLANLLCVLGGVTRTWWQERGHAPHHKHADDAVVDLPPRASAHPLRAAAVASRLGDRPR